MSARLTACTPLLLLSLLYQIQRAAMPDIWSLGVSLANAIIRHERLTYVRVERSCVLLVEHSHFAFVSEDGLHFPLLRYISDYSP
jgi:hypothetical protein